MKSVGTVHCLGLNRHLLVPKRILCSINTGQHNLICLQISTSKLLFGLFLPLKGAVQLSLRYKQALFMLSRLCLALSVLYLRKAIESPLLA